jgi:hypothetical protein
MPSSSSVQALKGNCPAFMVYYSRCAPASHNLPVHIIPSHCHVVSLHMVLVGAKLACNGQAFKHAQSEQV